MTKQYGNFQLNELFVKKTIKGVPKKEENLEENKAGYYMYGQNIQRQYKHKMLMDSKYLQIIDPNYPILAYTSSVGEIGLIDESFYRSGDNGAFQGLFPRTRKFTRRELQYILTTLKKHFSNYGYATSMAQIMNLTIQLPLIDGTKDQIDFNYMESYISKIEQECINELDSYLRTSGLNDYELTTTEKSILSKKCNFKEFSVLDFFDIKKGKRLTKVNMIDGNINFIGSTAENNGVTAKIGNNKHIHPGGTITVSYNGSVGEVFFQEDPFWASDDVNVWYPKEKWSTEVLQYFMTSIKKLSRKYSYSSKWTLEKMKSETICLPIKNDESIDYDFMQQYVKCIEKKVIADVVKYKNSFIQSKS